jgi:outer membrane protein assembly factor BamB
MATMRTPIGCSLLLLLAAGPARADDWASLGLDGPRSRLSAERSGALFGPGRWEYTLPAMKDTGYRALIASPAASDGYLVVGTLYNELMALREQDGAPVWKLAVGDAVHASPAVWRGWAYVVSTDRRVQAVRIADGSVVWGRTLGGISYASPVVADGGLFVATGDPAARVYRLDAETGKLVWTAGEGIFEQAAYAAVAVAEGHVIVAETRGRYHSFGMASGQWEWTAQAGGMVNVASPLVVNGRVYAAPGGQDSRVYAFELGTGQAVAGWPIDLPADPAFEGGTALDHGSVVSSLAGVAGQIVLDRRVEVRADLDGDGINDTVELTESVLALDPSDGKLLWSKPNGHLRTGIDGVPTHGLCPTPALYKGTSGETLVAVASSLAPTLRVLELGSGAERWSGELSGPSRGSPLLANGRLVIGTDAGVIHSFQSHANAAPAAPAALMGAPEVDAVGVTLRWSAAIDPEGERPSYEVRLDDDGEVLHDADLRVLTGAGQLSLVVPAPLAPGRVYTFAVRARDGQGAWSAWSAPAQFRTVETPSVQVDGTPTAGLAAALMMAHAGSIITLGAGVYPLSETLRLPAGVSLAGVAPHLTVLSGKGLAVAVQAGAGNQIRQLTVTGAEVGVEVTGGDDARLQNVLLRDNHQVGLRVLAGAGAQLVSATVARNGTGVRAAGKTEVRNVIITGNDVGIDATEAALLASRYNDVFANKTADYQGAQRSATDLAETVVFARPDDDLRLDVTQPSTDRGDPADDYANEPEPNGRRINLGAFGNTPFAELSAADLFPPPPPPPGQARDEKSSGGLCALGGSAPDGSLALVLLALLWRRRQTRVT